MFFLVSYELDVMDISGPEGQATQGPPTPGMWILFSCTWKNTLHDKSVRRMVSI